MAEREAAGTLGEIPAIIPPKWRSCQGQQLRKMARAGLVWLDRHHQHVNALNVFPVPDGDTGTNMLLTMRAAYKQVQNSDEMHAGRMASALAKGALMGARGNSGVILSQIWRGLAHGLRDKSTFSAAELAVALEEAAETAYRGVMKPVEGTILTVIREGAEEGKDAARKSEDLRFVLERVLERAQQALDRTPEMLPILKQAGVVDSGGQGLVYIFAGMLNYAQGELDLERQPAGSIGSDLSLPLPAQALAIPDGGSLDYPYDVQFILLGENLNVTAVRDRIDTMGDSTVVVGDETTIKVHIHVADPGEPLTYGISLGRIMDVVVENMQVQMEEIIHPDQVPPAPTPMLPGALAGLSTTLQPGQIGVVAVSPGPGIATIFESLGVAQIVGGGQTNNPSTEEIFQAIQDVPSDKVIILPNNKNIFLAAEAAAELSPKSVTVVPTRTVPQGISAMMGMNPDGDLAEVTAAMSECAGEVVTGEITTATRNVQLNGVDVAVGNIIGLVDGQICVAGDSISAVLAELLTAISLDECELVSLYYGQDTSAADAAEIANEISERYPEIELELLPGGQAHYYYILGAE